MPDEKELARVDGDTLRKGSLTAASDAGDFNAHELTLEFHRFLTEAEWREVTTAARDLPYVRHLRANAVRRS